MSLLAPEFSHTRQKAVDDARKMQALVEEDCAKAGRQAPDYRLTELTGKGSFGRVYKATDLKTSALVAVKIIDVDESDTMAPGLADTYSEILKEIGALKLLSEGGARNINHVIEALPVGHSMWMVTEYCAGGSVATLMRPTAPGGLQEKWIVPILREVAVAIFWVHKQGIIHRDIKCANVLITEVGGVQLCDFGVAGMMETKFDKRSTFIGTTHWMAPELFDQNSKYGTEVDIWAFGSMVYEIASGLPPNARATVGLPQFGDFLREHIPRLDGPQYPDELKSLVAFCLVENPTHRPSIDRVQQHPYIANTDARYPTSSLANLVKAYKLWEDRGGSRKSLFAPGGAQAPSDLSSTSLSADDWNFSTTLAFDERIHDDSDGMSEAEAVRDVYGTSVDFPGGFSEDTARPQANTKGRRRPPPQVLAAIKAPLEKVFDPNTISTYDENSRMYYGRLIPPPATDPPPSAPPTSDLPLRDNSSQNDLRTSLIDLDDVWGDGPFESFSDPDDIDGTLRPNAGAAMAAAADPPPFEPRGGGPRASMDTGWSFASQFSQPSVSRAVEAPTAMRQGGGPDWSWPTTIPPPEPPQLSYTQDPGLDTPDSGRPRLVHQATEPVLPSQGYDSQMAPPAQSQPRMSTTSLIDLDMGMMPEESGLPDLTRPSTANSDVASITGLSDQGAPFELERHASVYAPLQTSAREPSIYVSDESEYASAIAKHAANDVSDLQNGMSGLGMNGGPDGMENYQVAPPQPPQQQQQPHQPPYLQYQHQRHGRSRDGRNLSGGSSRSQASNNSFTTHPNGEDTDYLMLTSRRDGRGDGPLGPSPPDLQRPSTAASQRAAAQQQIQQHHPQSSSTSLSQVSSQQHQQFMNHPNHLGPVVVPPPQQQHQHLPPPHHHHHQQQQQGLGLSPSHLAGPPLPPVAPPSASVMEARATSGDVANEMRRLIGSLGDHLAILGSQVNQMEPRRATRQ